MHATTPRSPVSAPVDAQSSALADARSEANQLMGAGLGLGAFGAASAVLLGAVCPACVIAAPALLGYGVYKRVQCVRAARKICAEPRQDAPPQSAEPTAAAG